MSKSDFELNNFFNLEKANFYSSEKYNFPIIKKHDISINKLIPWNYRTKDTNGTCHFFLQDYMFNSVWNYPDKYLKYLNKFDSVLTPDFSLYIDFPIAIQIYNIYKNRWLGAYWQELGIKVIPTISWSDDKSFDFCFKGVEQNSIVAISTIGAIKNINLFKIGYEKMLEEIKPNQILIYGKEIENLDGNILYFENFTQKMQRRLKNGR